MDLKLARPLTSLRSTKLPLRQPDGRGDSFEHSNEDGVCCEKGFQYYTELLPGRWRLLHAYVRHCIHTRRKQCCVEFHTTMYISKLDLRLPFDVRLRLNEPVTALSNTNLYVH